MAHQGVDARCIDRHPAHRLCRVAYRSSADASRGPDDRVDIGDLAGSRLHERERHEGGFGRDRLGELCEGSGAHADATAGMQERQHERRELVFGDEHLRARVDPGGEKGDLHRRLRPDGDPIG